MKPYNFSHLLSLHVSACLGYYGRLHFNPTVLGTVASVRFLSGTMYVHTTHTYLYIRTYMACISGKVNIRIILTSYTYLGMYVFVHACRMFPVAHSMRLVYTIASV